jgi:TetR/AcrR family transcriptional regulator, cholesterol catabolism regulator
MSSKDLIWETALELFMKYGIKSVSMDDLAKTLGMSKKTIYTFISNKEDLVNKVLSKHIKKDEEAILEIINASDDALDAMVSITKHVLLFLRKIKPSLIFDLKKYHPAGWQMIETQHFRFIEDVIRNNILRGISEKLYREDADPEIIAKLYVAKSRYLVDEDYFPLTEYDRAGLLIQMIMYHLNGIVSDNGKEKLKSIQF